NLRTPRKPSNLDSAKVLAGKDLFVGANCQGCHGGDMWTIAKVFYTPDPNTAPATNVNKTLKTLSWKDSVTAAGLPSGVLPTTIDASMTMRYNGTRPADLDALTCMLRQVGTFNVAEAGVGIAELRRNMVAPAQGNEDTGKGYNVPGLLGLSVGAPYFHAGNARTLEAVLSDAFAAHHAALSPGFLAATDPDAAAKRAALIQFILSIDEDTAPIDIPALGPAGGIFCAAP
ncbi:MAG TPA: hypothetical protein VJT73_11340, partial [Polyangiaceae bacterium]|nr:hypothetical protein [Polyangiaceae bacterium]